MHIETIYIYRYILYVKNLLYRVYIFYGSVGQKSSKLHVYEFLIYIFFHPFVMDKIGLDDRGWLVGIWVLDCFCHPRIYHRRCAGCCTHIQAVYNPKTTTTTTIMMMMRLGRRNKILLILMLINKPK